MEKKKIIILGAGLAGLSAGLLLKKHGYTVTILEARSRVGGRVWTQIVQENPKLTVEMGGEWIGKLHHRMKQLCEDFHLPLIDHRLQMNLIYNRKYYQAGKWKFSDRFDSKLRQALKSIDITDKEKLQKLDTIDLWHYLVKNHIPQRDLEILDLIESTNYGESILLTSSADIPHLLLNFIKRDFTKSIDYFQIEGGNYQLPKKMSEAIGVEHIKLDHKVHEIHQDEKGVKVSCSNGSVWHGDKIICTMPAYALTKVVWNPSLPESQANAFSEINYCRIMKSSVVFSERFWKKETFEAFTDTLPHYIYHATQNQPGRAGVLTAYVTGDLAYTFAQLSKEQQKKEICSVLKIPFGDIEDKALRVIDYYWGDDPYTKGAYAIFRRFDETFTREHLIAPFKHVRFAGEHTSLISQGFMEGAVETGQEAAKEVIKEDLVL